MGKPTPNPLIPKEDNIKKLLEDTNICKKICSITCKDLNNTSNKKKILKKVDTYYSNTHDKDSDKFQSGKVWFLVKNQDNSLEVLQVAQSLDYDNRQDKGFFGEIYSHIEEIFNHKGDNIYSGFGREIRQNGELIFYELNIEEYLEKFAPSNYKEFIYRMACEYFAEASVAHFTQSREWGFYNSGMDKRALYYLYGNIKTLKIDEQKDEQL